MHSILERNSKTTSVLRLHDIYTEKPWRIHKRTIRANKEFSKVAEYQTNIQKSIVFLQLYFLQWKKNEYEITKRVSFTILQKILKFNKRSIKLILRNCKTLVKENKEDLLKRKTSHVQGLEDLILLRWWYPPNSIHSMQSPSEI